MSNAKRKGVSIRPSDATDDKKKLATTLYGVSYGEALETKWWGIGRRDDRRMDTKAPVFYLKATIRNMKPARKSFNYMERLVSLGGCDLAVNYPPRKDAAGLVSDLSFLLDEISDPVLFHNIHDFTQNTSFRWDAKISFLPAGKKARIEVWSPFVKEIFGEVGGDFMAPASVVCQVFQAKWLVENAPIKDRAIGILSDVWNEWEKWVDALLERGGVLLEKARHERI